MAHSTKSTEASIEPLVAHGVTQLVGERTVQRFRPHPQFNGETLPERLIGSR